MGVMEDKKTEGFVFNIQKCSVHDGPGIRTIVFLKGCPLSCRWCSNPESIHPEPDLAYNEGRCLTLAKCRRCLEACPRGAIQPSEEGCIYIDRNLCPGCDMPCAEACPSQALNVYGKRRSVDDVLRTVEQDAVFYARSTGGMTLSGGEPLLQIDFALALLREARRRRIHTAIETCGRVPWNNYEKTAPYINYYLYDIKHMNDDKHIEFTGASNKITLDNLRKLSALVPEKTILCRTPVVPGFNDNAEDIRAICEFIKPLANVHYELLPYHRLGTQKYIFLGRTPQMGDVQLDKSIIPKLLETAVGILGRERVVLLKK
ncbi:MAG: glycyl-radical enzyme activating protein [bacterium]|nr:glycyl-radical enzyme activating protein [bacterium]